ncbi:unnamed protein product [Coccothraustes coccothraustes]
MDRGRPERGSRAAPDREGQPEPRALGSASLPRTRLRRLCPGVPARRGCAALAAGVAPGELPEVPRAGGRCRPALGLHGRLGRPLRPRCSRHPGPRLRKRLSDSVYSRASLGGNPTLAKNWVSRASEAALGNFQFTWTVFVGTR